VYRNRRRTWTKCTRPQAKTPAVPTPATTTPISAPKENAGTGKAQPAKAGSSECIDGVIDGMVKAAGGGK